MKKVLMGHVAVDSGQLLIMDPCYIDSMWEREEFDPDTPPKHPLSYNSVSQTTLDSKYGEMGLSWAVISRSGYGDGLYPVYGYLNNDDRVIKIVVEMNS